MILSFLSDFHYTVSMKKLSLIVFSLLFLGYAFPVEATQSFSVSPVSLEIRKSDQPIVLTVKNNDSNPLRLTVSFKPITIHQGKTIVAPENDEYRTLFAQISSELENNSLTLNAGEQSRIRFSIKSGNLPKQDLPFAVVLSTQQQEEPEDRSFSHTIGSIAVPILFSSSESRPLLLINTFHTPFFNSSKPIPFTLSLQNYSDTFGSVSGSITIQNLVGTPIAKIPISKHYILADSSREITSLEWNPPLLLGLYQATLSLQYGGETIQQRVLFIGVPVKLIIVSAIALLMAAGIYLRVKKYR